MDRITNEVTFQRMNTEKYIRITTKKHKLQYLGHFMRNDNGFHHLQQIIE